MRSALGRALLWVGVVVVMADLSTTAAARVPKYRLKVKANSHVDFSRFKTYGWVTVPINEPNRQAMDAVDRQMAAFGLARVESQPSDLLVGAASISRTD